MQIKTIAIFYDEETKETTEGRFIFDLFDVGNINETDSGYICITNNTTGVRNEVKIKFDTYWELIKLNYIKHKEIIE